MYLIDITLTRVLLLYERLAAQLCVQKKEVCFVSPFDTDFIVPTVFSFLFIVFVYCNACTICHVFDIRSEIKEHLILNPTSAWCSLEFLGEQ